MTVYFGKIEIVKAKVTKKCYLLRAAAANNDKNKKAADPDANLVVDDQSKVQPTIQPKSGTESLPSTGPFHETGYSYNTNTITIYPTGPEVYLLGQWVYVPASGAEFVATFSAEADTESGATLAINLYDNGILIPPGTVYYAQQGDNNDRAQAHSFTFGKDYLNPGWHYIGVKAYSYNGKAWVDYKSLVTEIEERPP